MLWICGASRRALAATLTSAALLTACATTPSVSPPDRAYSGRFAVTTAFGEKRENVSGRFNFEVRGPQQVLELASPLGTTVARIEVEPGGARAIGPQMQEVRGADADALSEQLLGWRLPVAGLADWIEGRPVAQRAARVQRDGDRIALIDQDGWEIRLSEYFEGFGRPRRLSLERPAGPGTPSVLLRLVVDEPGG
jgi:outer membrane lipoprotein LolB